MQLDVEEIPKESAVLYHEYRIHMDKQLYRVLSSQLLHTNILISIV